MAKAEEIKRLNGEEYVTGYLYSFFFSSQDTVVFCNANTGRKMK